MTGYIKITAAALLLTGNGWALSELPPAAPTAATVEATGTTPIPSMPLPAAAAPSSTDTATAGIFTPEAPTGLRLVYDMDGMTITLTRDDAGTVQVDGLPFPGLILYRPDTRVVYYQQPESIGWLSITPDMTAGYGSPAVAVAGAAWQPYMDAPTQRWEMKTAQMTCDNWFASAKAGQVAGLTGSDIQRVLITLQWLLNGKPGVACDRLMPDDATSARIGLPLYFSAMGGRWRLTAMEQGPVPTITLPESPRPADDDARLNILLKQWDSANRKKLLKDIADLPLAKQLEAVQRALGDGMGD